MDRFFFDCTIKPSLQTIHFYYNCNGRSRGKEKTHTHTNKESLFISSRIIQSKYGKKKKRKVISKDGLEKNRPKRKKYNKKKCVDVLFIAVCVAFSYLHSIQSNAFAFGRNTHSSFVWFFFGLPEKWFVFLSFTHFEGAIPQVEWNYFISLFIRCLFRSVARIIYHFIGICRQRIFFFRFRSLR